MAETPHDSPLPSQGSDCARDATMTERLFQRCPVPGSDFSITIRFREAPRERYEGLRIPLDFAHGSILISPSMRTVVVAKENPNVSLMLHGELYVCDVLDRHRQAKIALDAYLSMDEREFARSLNGTFVLVIVDNRKEGVLVVTDRVGFRKVFVRRADGDVHLASSPSLVPAETIDPVGVLTYLSNAFIFSGRTVRAEVHALSRAAIHTISPAGVTSLTYWQYDFPGAEADSIAEGAVQEYAELMRRAVARRIPSGSGRIFVSLSGGIDSRSVLGCLLEAIADKRRLVAFSYGTPTDDDVVLAARVAEYAGVEHRVSAFRGELESTIRQNAALGEGLVSFYTHGINALGELRKDFSEEDVLFVGDLAVQRGTREFADPNDVLVRGMEIRSPMKVPAYLSTGQYDVQDLQRILDRDISELKARVSHMTDMQDVHDFLFLDQRTSNMLLPWREFLTGRFITVCDPFLDNDILDFYRAQPRSFRYDKRLHRIATQHMFPELCGLGFGKSGVDNTAVHARLIQESRALDRLVSGFPSGLDALLPPGVVGCALRELRQSTMLDKVKMPRWLRLVVDKARHRYLRHNLSRRLSRGSDVSLPCLGLEQMERLLTLRLLLALR